MFKIRTDIKKPHLYLYINKDGQKNSTILYIDKESCYFFGLNENRLNILSKNIKYEWFRFDVSRNKKAHFCLYINKGDQKLERLLFIKKASQNIQFF